MTQAHTTPEPCRPRLFNDEVGARIVRERVFEQVHGALRTSEVMLTSALSIRFSGFERSVVQDEAERSGMMIMRSGSPAPRFWFGVAWKGEDVSSLRWGTQLQLRDEHTTLFERNIGNLRTQCERAAATTRSLTLHRSSRLVELGCWRRYEWLVGRLFQVDALERYWVAFLDMLVARNLVDPVMRFSVASRS